MVETISETISVVQTLPGSQKLEQIQLPVSSSPLAQKARQSKRFVEPRERASMRRVPSSVSDAVVVPRRPPSFTMEWNGLNRRS